MRFSILMTLLVFTLGFALAITETGTDSGTLKVGSGDAYTCQEHWECSWSACVSNSQTYVCTDLNSCGTTDLIPANNGATQECGTSSGGGGGGGGSSTTYGTSDNDTTSQEGDLAGSSSSCLEDWACQPWSNAEEECGTRVCEDLNRCGSEALKPLEEKECVSTRRLSGLTGAVTGAAEKVVSTPKIYIPTLFGILVIAGGLFFILGKKKKK